MATAGINRERYLVAMVKDDGHRFVLLFGDDANAAIEQLGGWAADPELNFDLDDVDKLTGSILDLTDEH